MHEFLIHRDIQGGDWQLSLRHAQQPERQLARLTLRWQIGQRQPRHWYHLGTVVHAAPELQLYHRQATLLMGNDLTGAVELAEVVVAPLADPADAAGAGNSAEALKALVQGALAWAAAADGEGAAASPAADAAFGGSPAAPEPGRGGLRVFAELPGPRDAQGQSPFWQGLGQHFFPFTAAQAERRFGPGWTRDVAALLPRHPLLVSFLPEAAQAVLSVPDPAALALADALQAEGLMPGEHVGILDGGPVYQAFMAALPRVRQAGPRRLAPGLPPSALPARPAWLGTIDGQRLHRLQAVTDATHCWLGDDALEQLGSGAGQTVWWSPAD